MKKISLLIFYTFCFLFAFGQANTYQKALEKFLSTPELKNASIGVYAENLTTGKIIMDHNSSTSLIPASVFKIFPTAVALELFGPNHKFKTELAYNGNIDPHGTLHGNIYIIGYGDPCLGSLNFKEHYGNVLDSWVDEIKKLGIKKITGDIVSDISYFGEINIPNTWIWEDIGNYYGNPGSALNYYDNMYYLHFITGFSEGSETKITKVVPADLDIKFVNQVTSSTKTTDESCIYIGGNNNERVIRGTLPVKKVGYVIKGSTPEPELYLAKSLSSKLNNNNIIISGTQKVISSSDDNARKVFYTVYSPELQKIAEETNVKSNNLYAEVLSHHIAKKTGKAYSEAVKDFLGNNKIDTDGLNISDACGLSHFNTLTTKQMTQLLKYMKKTSKQGENFIKTLPVAGVNGTLAAYSIGKNTKLQAKSGSMRRVRTYAGYITDDNNNEIVFCFIVNNFNCSNYRMRKVYEGLFKEISL